MASRMQVWAGMGHPCGYPFVAKDFLRDHPEYNWTKDILRDLPSQPWTVFSSDMKR
jgi:hypothetical protein